MTWTRKGNGYYIAVSRGGLAVTILQSLSRPPLWRVYAGDRTDSRAVAKTLREAKQKAEAMFG